MCLWSKIYPNLSNSKLYKEHRTEEIDGQQFTADQDAEHNVL